MQIGMFHSLEVLVIEVSKMLLKPYIADIHWFLAAAEK